MLSVSVIGDSIFKGVIYNEERGRYQIAKRIFKVIRRRYLNKHYQLFKVWFDDLEGQRYL